MKKKADSANAEVGTSHFGCDTGNSQSSMPIAQTHSKFLSLLILAFPLFRDVAFLVDRLRESFSSSFLVF
jgi:hypothetical protein